jgi:hypothetical protein
VTTLVADGDTASLVRPVACAVDESASHVTAEIRAGGRETLLQTLSGESGAGRTPPSRNDTEFRGSFAENINQERPYGRVWVAPDGGEQVLDVQLPTVAVLLKPRVPVDCGRIEGGEEWRDNGQIH